jgi:hypothetical protein
LALTHPAIGTAIASAAQSASALGVDNPAILSPDP